MGPKRQIEIARKHAEYGKTVKVPQAWPDRTVEELHHYSKHIDGLKVEAFEEALESYRENEIKVKVSIDDADRLRRKVEVTEVIAARKKAANMLKAQMDAPNKRAASKIAQKRLHVLGNVSHIESEFFNMDRPHPPPSTWYDINRRVSKIPLVIGKPLPSIKDGDNYNPKAYPVHVPWVDPVKSAEEEEEALENDLYAGLPKKLKPKKVVEKEEQKIEKKSTLFNSPLSFFDKLQLKQTQKKERDAELEKYAALLKESEGPKKEQVTPFDESIPDPKQLPEAETEGEKSVVPPQPVEDAKVPTQN